MQTDNGPDRIEEKLDGIGSIEVVPRAGPLQSDLERLFAQLMGHERPLEFVRTSEKPGQSLAASPAISETSAHLARLWANDEVRRLIATQDKERLEEATRLAARYQLVTPVSGAVVLETREQYNRAGLEPVDAGTVPTIPEPETVLLVMVVLAVLSWLLYRTKLLRRRTTL
jgi:hypothetical protein